VTGAEPSTMPEAKRDVAVAAPKTGATNVMPLAIVPARIFAAGIPVILLPVPDDGVPSAPPLTRGADEAQLNPAVVDQFNPFVHVDPKAANVGNLVMNQCPGAVVES
jgi:hypothetical protein